MRFAVPLLVLLSVLSLSVGHVHADGTECGYDGVDLSSLMGKDYSYPNPSGDYVFYLSVCGKLATQPDCMRNDAESSVCRHATDPTAFPPADSTGKWDPSSVVWGKIDPSDAAPNGGLTYILKGGLCDDTGSVDVFTSTIMFICERGASTPTLEVTSSKACNYEYQLKTAAACSGGGGGKGGLSGGWVFIIILCVVIPVYIIVGCIYKKQRTGASGMEMCPNIDFWRSLPGLVKDGCRYTWSKLTGPCRSGTQANGGQTYETM